MSRSSCMQLACWGMKQWYHWDNLPFWRLNSFYILGMRINFILYNIPAARTYVRDSHNVSRNKRVIGCLQSHLLRYWFKSPLTGSLVMYDRASGEIVVLVCWDRKTLVCILYKIKEDEKDRKKWKFLEDGDILQQHYGKTKLTNLLKGHIK